MTDWLGQIDVTKFVRNMGKRLNEGWCKECSIHAARVGPSVNHDDCRECHQRMESEYAPSPEGE
jgi:hypothetical protein